MKAKQVKRNGHACHPIMKKGGVHEKSTKAKRGEAKRVTSYKVKEWETQGKDAPESNG
jgi:hypothetical protein